MKLNIAEEVKALKSMTVGELRERYREFFGEESWASNKGFLRKRIVWRIQALAEGDLSERARRRAEELANDADLRIRPPKQFPASAMPEGRTVVRQFSPSHDRRLPMPGTVLTRQYRGEMVMVTILDGGFEYEGQVYRSLTAVAGAITGTHWNGFHFFGLRDKGAA